MFMDPFLDYVFQNHRLVESDELLTYLMKARDHFGCKLPRLFSHFLIRISAAKVTEVMVQSLIASNPQVSESFVQSAAGAGAAARLSFLPWSYTKTFFFFSSLPPTALIHSKLKT